jgi:hypothetical protein
VIFKERDNIASIKLPVVSHFSVFQTGKPLIGTNPKTPIARSEKSSNITAREVLARRRLPRDGPSTVEVKQTKLRAEPEITVRRLSNRADDAFEKAVADRPRGVGVLIDVERGV